MGIVRKTEPRETIPARKTAVPPVEPTEGQWLVPRLLINMMRARKEAIAGTVRRLIRESDFQKTYRDFLADSQEGRRRIAIVYEMIVKALQGDLESLVEDQFRTGYLRATQGVPLEETLKIHRMFERTIIDEFLNMYLDSDMSYRDLQEEMKILGSVIDKARETVSKSYLKTREEIIEKRAEQIEGLYRLRAALGDNVSIQGLSKVLIDDISKILGASYTILTLYRTGTDMRRPLRLGNSTAALDMFQNDGMDGILERMRDLRRPHLVDRVNKALYSVSPEGLSIVPSGYWLTIPVFTSQNFYGFLSISTFRLNERFIGADSYVVLSVVSKIAEAMEKDRTLRTLRKSQIELRRLAGTIIQAQEEERRKISAEIHDTIIQKLTGIWYKLLYIDETRACLQREHTEDLDFLKKHTNESIQEARKIVYGLRPLMLDQLGLQKTVEEHAGHFQAETSIKVDLSIDGDCSALLPGVQISLFRILQEALENVRKHSGSPRVKVGLRCDDKGCRFRVEDYGSSNKADHSKRRPDLSRSHFGLMIMSERAKSVGGTLRYFHKKEGGFVVQGSVPCG